MRTLKVEQNSDSKPNPLYSSRSRSLDWITYSILLVALSIFAIRAWMICKIAEKKKDELATRDNWLKLKAKQRGKGEGKKEEREEKGG